MSQRLKINIGNYPKIREFMLKLNDPKDGLKIGDLNISELLLFNNNLSDKIPKEVQDLKCYKKFD